MKCKAFIPETLLLTALVVLAGCDDDAAPTATGPSEVLDASIVADSATDAGLAGLEDGGVPVGSPPNILLVILDDFGLDFASFDPQSPCYAVGDISNDPVMPNIAALCAEGLTFTAAWATPTCSPTRASMLTGTHAHQHGVLGPLTQGSDQFLANDVWTLPQALAAAPVRYATANIGKWHVSFEAGDPNTLGWDHYAGVLGGGLGNYSNWERTVDGVTATSATYATTANIDDATAWLDTVPDEQPWLLWLAFNAPHTPYHVPPVDLHGRDLVAYEEGMDAHPYAAAMSEALDAELGRLIQTLKDRGEWANTLVVVLGDNGSAVGVGDLPYPERRRKGTLYQGGLAVPMIIAGAGVAGAPRAVDTLVSVVDLFPTLLEVAGVDVAAASTAAGASLDGVGFADCIRDPGHCGGGAQVVSAYANEGTARNNGIALRTRTHKLICFDTGSAQLYDLRADPWEAADLFDAADPTYLDLRARMREAVLDPSRCP